MSKPIGVILTGGDSLAVAACERVLKRLLPGIQVGHAEAGSAGGPAAGSAAPTPAAPGAEGLLKAASEIAQIAVGGGDADAALRGALERLAAALGAGRTWVAERLEGGEARLLCSIERERAPAEPPQPPPADAVPALAVIPDAARTPGLAGPGVRAALLVPAGAGADAAWLAAEDAAEPRSWGEGELALMRSAALAVAWILERRRWEQALRRREAELLQAEKMAAVGVLIGGVAHELNNPLTAILGNAQLLMLEAPEQGGTLKEDLAVIEREAKRCRRLVRSLLGFARKQDPQRLPCDVNQLVLEIVDLKAFDLRRAKAALELKLGQSLPAVVADSQQIQQVVLNLLNNAEQALGGRPGKVTVGTFADGKQVVIEVVDDGPGIPSENRRRLFKPFFTTKPAGQGTGLGLSICAAIIRDHGGVIDVDSEPGRGARFKVRLPSAGGPGAAAAPASTGRILVVDDSVEVLSFMRRALEQAGWTVEACVDPAAALEKLAGESFDCVITDFEMPGMDGQAFYRRAVALRPEHAARFVVCTAEAKATAAKPFADRTGLPLLLKPFDLEEFRRVLASLTGAKGGKA